MLPGAVVLVTDRPDRSLAVSEALRAVAGCEVVGTDAAWSSSTPLLGVVSDLTLSRPEAAHCLQALRDTYKGSQVPLICLTRSTEAAAQRQAQSLGATTCLSAFTPPHTVVATLLRHIKPVESTASETALSARVSRGAQHATQSLSNLFQAAGDGEQIDMAEVEGSLSPILLAVSDGGLTRWLDTVWAYDNATYQHCLLVAGLAAQFALHLGFKKADQHRFVRAALVHDVGKAKIPQAILNKPGRLDPDEMSVMRTHAALGFEILKASSEVDALTLDAVRHHHEMLDGSGYPDGLSGEAVSDVVRLLTICDIYAALTERRPYKEPMPTGEAMAVLHGMGGKLEAGFVQAFGTAVSAALRH